MGCYPLEPPDSDLIYECGVDGKKLRRLTHSALRDPNNPEKIHPKNRRVATSRTGSGQPPAAPTGAPRRAASPEPAAIAAWPNRLFDPVGDFIQAGLAARALASGEQASAAPILGWSKPLIPTPSKRTRKRPRRNNLSNLGLSELMNLVIISACRTQTLLHGFKRPNSRSLGPEMDERLRRQWAAVEDSRDWMGRYFGGLASHWHVS